MFGMTSSAISGIEELVACQVKNSKHSLMTNSLLIPRNGRVYHNIACCHACLLPNFAGIVGKVFFVELLDEFLELIAIDHMR